MPSRNRPGDWNGQVLWLLERTLGLLSTQGKGTESTEIPRGAPRSGVVHYVKGSHAGVDSSEVTAIQLPATTRSWKLTSLQYNPGTGGAATYQLRIGQDSAFAAGGVDERVVFTSVATNVVVNDSFCAGIMLRADSDNRVYLKPGFSGSTDNNGIYQLWFEEYIETIESTS